MVNLTNDTIFWAATGDMIGHAATTKLLTPLHSQTSENEPYSYTIEVVMGGPRCRCRPMK